MDEHRPLVYYANPRVYGRRHLEIRSWNQGRLAGHLELAHGIPFNWKNLTLHLGSYVRAEHEIHLQQDHSWMATIRQRKGVKV